METHPEKRLEIEEKAKAEASAAYHADPKNVRKCRAYRAFYGKTCPCKRNWRKFLPSEERE